MEPAWTQGDEGTEGHTHSCPNDWQPKEERHGSRYAAKTRQRVNKPVLSWLSRAVYVFDVSQTEGAELPQFTERTTGEVGEYRERLFGFISAQDIELEFKESIAPALGMSYGGKIAILPGQDPAEEFSALSFTS